MNKVFLNAYITCALWSSTDSSTPEGGNPLDDNYDQSDIAPETMERMRADCVKFLDMAQADLLFAKMDDSRAGHNFWLNRNGHGSGFWDEYSATTCDLYKRAQEIAVVTRSFTERDALHTKCNCPYHACQRLSTIAKTFGTFDLYLGDDGLIYGS